MKLPSSIKIIQRIELPGGGLVSTMTKCLFPAQSQGLLAKCQVQADDLEAMRIAYAVKLSSFKGFFIACVRENPGGLLARPSHHLLASDSNIKSVIMVFTRDETLPVHSDVVSSMAQACGYRFNKHDTFIAFGIVPITELFELIKWFENASSEQPVLLSKLVNSKTGIHVGMSGDIGSTDVMFVGKTKISNDLVIVHGGEFAFDLSTMRKPGPFDGEGINAPMRVLMDPPVKQVPRKPPQLEVPDFTGGNEFDGAGGATGLGKVSPLKMFVSKTGPDSASTYKSSSSGNTLFSNHSASTAASSAEIDKRDA